MTRKTQAPGRGRRIARRARRGAVMVEALVVIPFFILINMMILFMTNLYLEKLRTIRESKACAWESAMKGNCEGGCGQISGFSSDDIDLGSESNPSQGHPQVDSWLTKTFKQSSSIVEGSATAHSWNGWGGWTMNLKTKQVVICNEKPENHQFRSIFLYTYHKLTPW